MHEEDPNGMPELIVSNHGEEILATVGLMNEMGGSFVKALAQAWIQGDRENQRRIMQSFPEYFCEYAYLAGLKRGSEKVQDEQP